MDKYDKAIEYLTKHPYEIFNAWTHHSNHIAGCLFAPLSKDSKFGKHSNGRTIGCPTMIKTGWAIAETNELTQKVLDSVIPGATKITVEDLPLFAEIQRLADTLIRNT